MTDLIPPLLRFGPYEMDRNTRELRKSGIRVKISGQPFAILAALLERPGQLVSRDDLRKRIWAEDTFVDFGHGLNAAVNKLREALCDSAEEPRYIETLPRRGYRFIAQVEELRPLPVPVTTVAPGVAQLQQSASRPAWKDPWADEDWQSTVPVKRQSIVQLSALIVLIVLFGFGAIGFWAEWWSSPSAQEAERREKREAELSTAAEAQKKELGSKPAKAGDSIDPHSESLEQYRKAIGESAAPIEQERSPAPALELGHSNGTKSLKVAETASEHSASEDSSIYRLAQSGQRIKIFQERSLSEPPAILHFDLAHPTDTNSLRRVVSGQEAIAGPQPSPDGKKLVFTSGSYTSMEVWVCNPDGTEAKVITHMGRTGTPRWSPDSRWIAFDSDGRFSHSGIYVVSVEGGPVRSVVVDDSNNSVPSWSRDGKYIYFASNRGQGEQVWKVPSEGGQPIQITRAGGFSAFESPDAKTLFYAKNRYQNPEIWQVPVDGGVETRVSLLHPSTWASWAVTNQGILLLSEYSGQKSELEYFDFASRSIHSLATLEKASFWLASSANGSSIWYSELTDYQASQVFKAGFD
ncbi:MAG TPA: winged helix-turn-helix domain-containing protein [Candidatus Acidoferrum sp.]|nr:winged helix-turn-helix domain-containing protein [Candidatus Acidoferrum sp.]